MAILITPSAKLSTALKLHPEVLPYIVSLNPHDFERLQNSFMQKIMPPRIIMARLAEMTDAPLLEILLHIHEICDEPLSEAEIAELQECVEAETAVKLPKNPDTPPEWTQQEVIAVVDLLDADERLDTDPMPPIFRALNPSNPGDVVLLKHKWEPQPLYDVWALRGIEHASIQKSEDEWWVYLRKPVDESETV